MSKRDFNKSSNPMIGEDKFKTILDSGMVGEGQKMTVSGAVNKTLLLMAVMLASALFAFTFPNQIMMWVGILGGAGVMWFASSNPSRSPILAPIFAALEGLVVGTISFFYANAFLPGIIFQAVTLTFAILFMMLMLYKAGVIKVTQKLRAGISMAVGAVMLFYLINIVCHFIGINIPFIHEGGLLSIGITLVIIGIASMNLLLDFDNFDRGEEAGAPAYMEWYFGMGLLFTLVWLYLEILRLLSYLSND